MHVVKHTMTSQIDYDDSSISQALIKMQFLMILKVCYFIHRFCMRVCYVRHSSYYIYTLDYIHIYVHEDVFDCAVLFVSISISPGLWKGLGARISWLVH